MTLRVGLLVNPIAGLGGPAALKGSDNHWQEALDAGIEPAAQNRAKRFVAGCRGIDWLTVPGAMGVPGLPVIDLPPTELGKTTAADTHTAVKALVEAGVHLICFVGGDGTASDVAHVAGSTPCLGIPGGVKITSPVFAHDLDEAAWLLNQLDPGFETIARDVTDLDEEAYRAGQLHVSLRGQLHVPLSPAVQGGKVATVQDTPLEPLVDHVLRDWDKEAVHLIGAGSVCGAIKARFWGNPTLLGIDAIQGDRIIATDLDQAAITKLVADSENVHLWLSIIGGQGMLLGRGTQMLAPTTLERIGWPRIHVVAPPEKLIGVRALHVDSGSQDFDASAPNYIRIMSGWNETRMVRIAHGAPDA